MKRLVSVFLLSFMLLLPALTGCHTNTMIADGASYPSQQKGTVFSYPASVLSVSNVLQQGEKTFRMSEVPAYDGKAYVALNGNLPYFRIDNLSSDALEYYSDLDALGRCGVVYACVGQETMPTTERGSIGQIKPSGWQMAKYDHISGKYLYNRCHLIGYQLTAENANPKNLITGTRYLNVEGMLPFENMVADYVKETENHVAYRVTPVFEGNNLLASGVLMEGYSVEDAGEGICFCIFAYNVQPNIRIDYATGESELAEENGASVSAPAAQTPSAPVPSEPASSAPEQSNQEMDAPVSEAEGVDYILNKNTKKFHYPSCRSVKQMKESNKLEYTGDRETLISQNYSPCGNCHP